MRNDISDAPLTVVGDTQLASPSVLESEVIRMREDARRVLEELERRYERLKALPGEIKAKVRAMPAQALHFLARPTVIIVAASAAVLVGVLVFARSRRPKTFKEKLIDWLDD